MQQFLDLSELTGTNPALLQKSGILDSMLRENQNAVKIAEKQQLANIDYKADVNFNSTYAELKTPAERKAWIEENWPDIVRRKGNFKAAHDYLTKLVQEVDVDGKATYDEQALFSAKIGSRGGTFKEDHKERVIEIQKTLASARDSAFRSQESRRQIEAIQDFRSIKDGLSEQLAAAGAREDQDILSTAIKEFKDKYEGFVPPQMLDLQRSTLAENKQDNSFL